MTRDNLLVDRFGAEFDDPWQRGRSMAFGEATHLAHTSADLSLTIVAALSGESGA